MLRIHFTGPDLERIRVAGQPDPLWEIICSVCRLQTREGPQAFDLWRRRVRDGVRRGGGPGRSARALSSLVPFARYFPDFLTPSGERRDHALEDGIDRVLSTPRRQLHHEIGLVAADGHDPFAGPALARGEREVLLLLGGMLRVYHETFIAPVRDAMEGSVRADVSRRAHVLLTDGVHGLLNSFRPMARWQSPVLEADYPVDRDVHLEGRGLLLIPSYFCWRRPITLVDSSMQPVLVYPVEKCTPLVSTAGHAELGRLLGPTRAALLRVAAARAWGTTSQLAAGAGISLPSASQQLAVLRETGLLSSRREGKHVLHAATWLGRRLLGGG